MSLASGGRGLQSGHRLQAFSKEDKKFVGKCTIVSVKSVHTFCVQ